MSIWITGFAGDGLKSFITCFFLLYGGDDCMVTVGGRMAVAVYDGVYQGTVTGDFYHSYIYVDDYGASCAESVNTGGGCGVQVLYPHSAEPYAGVACTRK